MRSPVSVLSPIDFSPVRMEAWANRRMVYALYDQRTDQFGELGSPYGTGVLPDGWSELEG